MKIFVDTEFTNFSPLPCELISIGCVSDTGETFYAVLTDYNLGSCSQFVKETVLPILDMGDPCRGNTREVGVKLAGWLNSIGNPLEVVVDYGQDAIFMMELLKAAQYKTHIQYRNHYSAFDDLVLESFWQEARMYGWTQHHALYDAIANKRAYNPA